MNNICRRHGSGMALARRNGGWTTICPWCDEEGRYSTGAAEDRRPAPMYQYTAQNTRPAGPALYSRERFGK